MVMNISSITKCINCGHIYDTDDYGTKCPMCSTRQDFQEWW